MNKNPEKEKGSQRLPVRGRYIFKKGIKKLSLVFDINILSYVLL